MSTLQVAALVARARRCLANGYRPVPVLRHDAPAAVERGGKTVRQSPGKQPHGALWADKEQSVYNASDEDVTA
jgi:hypothetical protein